MKKVIEIRVAKSEEDLKAVYELRHLVYVKQDGKFGGINFPNKMMSDKFDKYSINLIAIKDYVPIGTIRGTEDIHGLGLPIDEHYDISEIRRTRKYNKPLFCVGMLAADERYKRSLGLLMNLFRFLFTLAIQSGLKDVVVIVNHEHETVMNKIGLKRIGKEFWAKGIKNYVVPMYATKEMLSDFLYERTISPEFIPFGESFRRIILNKGENLCKEGDAGNEFYIITKGSVNVYKKHSGGSEYRVAMLGPGNVIGEMALVEKDAKRSATVRANITGTVFKALSKDDFLEALKNPKKALALSRILMEKISLLNSCVRSTDICNRVEAEKAIPIPEKLLDFIKNLNCKEFKAGKIICKEGEKGNIAYIIEEGNVEVYVGNARVAALPKDSLFGEIAPLGNSIRTATVITSSETTVREIPKKVLLNMLGDHEIAKYLFLILCNRIKEMNKKLTDTDIKRRIGKDIIELLVRMQNEREFDDYFAYDDKDVRDTEWVSQSLGYEIKDIELFLTQLKKAKIIIFDESKEIHILNTKKLKSFSFTIDITN